MSRTTRNPIGTWQKFSNEAAYIADNMKDFNGTKWVSTRQVTPECVVISVIKSRKITHQSKSFWVRPLFNTQIEWKYEDAVAYYKARYAALSYDGAFNETTRNTGFKRDANRQTRRQNKEFCNRVLKSDKWDNEAYPRRQDAKHHRWSWW